MAERAQLAPDEGSPPPSRAEGASGPSPRLGGAGRDPLAETPTFSAMEVARLFGVRADVAAVVRRWLQPGLLRGTTRTATGGRSGTRVLWSIPPAALLAFVRAQPEAYAPGLIRDPALRAEAERVHARDPLVPLGAMAERAGIDAAQLRRLAKGGAFPSYPAPPGTTPPGTARERYVHRSQVEATLAAVARLRAAGPQGAAALAALHALLEQEQPRATAATAAPAAPPAPRCPRCGTRLVRAQDEDGAAIDSCLACGHSAPADPLARAREAERIAAVRTEGRAGPRHLGARNGSGA